MDNGGGLGDDGGRGLGDGGRLRVSLGGGGLAGRDGGADGVAAAVGGGNGAGGSDAVALGALGDTELVGVLELAGDVVNELETVVGHVSLEAGRGSPLVGSAVGDAGDDGGEGLDVLGRATEEDKRDRVGGGWLPGDGELLACRDDLVLCVSVDSY